MRSSRTLTPRVIPSVIQTATSAAATRREARDDEDRAQAAGCAGLGGLDGLVRIGLDGAAQLAEVLLQPGERRDDIARVHPARAVALLRAGGGLRVGAAHGLRVGGDERLAGVRGAGQRCLGLLCVDQPLELLDVAAVGGLEAHDPRLDALLRGGVAVVDVEVLGGQVSDGLGTRADLAHQREGAQVAAAHRVELALEPADGGAGEERDDDEREPERAEAGAEARGEGEVVETLHGWLWLPCGRWRSG